MLGADDESFTLSRVDFGNLRLEDFLEGATRSGSKEVHLHYTAEDQVVKSGEELVHLGAVVGLDEVRCSTKLGRRLPPLYPS